MIKIVIDVRHLRDFGIGTYIRNLVQALAHADRENEYVLVSLPDEVRLLAGLSPNFKVSVYKAGDSRPAEHIAFPLFLRQFSADVHHIPLNQVPLLMLMPQDRQPRIRSGAASWSAIRSTPPSCSTPAISARRRTFRAW